MKKRYNCFGCELEIEATPELADPSYGEVIDGEIVPYWPEESDAIDADGFDKTNIEDNGKYKNEVILPKGTMLCRYGLETGVTTTTLGSPYDMLGLPYKIETIEYHEYVVIADSIRVKCIVEKGRVAKAFDSEGGAIQFVHKQSIMDEVKTGRLKEVTSWLNRKN